MTTCQWKNCRNVVLMDNFCVRHLKQRCAVCMEDVPSTNSAKHKRLSCGHAFHFNCIMRWFVTSDECPTCRCKQPNDPLVIFKCSVEDELRKKYRDAIRSLESENNRLNQTLTRRSRTST